jgi:CheY-like chemotaxis protein
MDRGGDAQSGRILVIEDDPGTREAIQDALETEGYAVVTAIHGRDAFEQLRRMEPPCLILLDLMMPVMSGGEFLVALRATKELAHLPIVVVSAWPDEAEKIRGEIQGFVKKPIELDALCETVERFCLKRQDAA